MNVKFINLFSCLLLVKERKGTMHLFVLFLTSMCADI